MRISQERSPELPERLLRQLQRRQIPTLNGLRALAVILVIFYHAGLPLPGGFGVLIFFVLSGFLITWLLLQEFRRTGGISLKKFYLRRTLRIFPAFYVYFVLVIGFLLIAHKLIIFNQVLASLLYVNNYYQAIRGDPNTAFSHTWSLAVEEQYYLIWAPTLLFILRRGKILPSVSIAIAVLWVHRLVLVLSGVSQGYIYEAFDTRADQLLIGSLLACLLFKHKWVPLFRFACNAWTTTTVAIVLTILNICEFRYGPQFRDLVGFSLEPALVAILIPGLICASETLVGRFLELAPVSGLGMISYSMYLYQQVIVSPTKRVLFSQPVFVQAFACLFVSAAAGLLSYYLIEKPFLRLKSLYRS